MQVMVRVEHARQAKLCLRGCRKWAAHHGFDWNEFLDIGIPADAMEATGDPFALQVVKIAREEAENGFHP